MKKYSIIVLLLLPLFLVRGVGAQRILDYDTCGHLRLWEDVKPSNQSEAKRQYDTLCLYIEKCAASNNDSYQVFTALDGAVQRLNSKDTARFDKYREWLKSIIYLNTSEHAYFCRVLAL